MGIFGALFGGDNKEMKTDFWNEIVSDEVIDDLLKRSHAEDVIIFKHSTRCFISKTVLKNVEQQVKTLQPKGSFYFLDLLKFRKLSNRIADELSIDHQSPQLILIRNGVAVFDASHQSIDLKTLPQ